MSSALDEARNYLKEQNLEEQITSAISQVVREKAPDAALRVAEILCQKAGKIPTPPVIEYTATVGNTPMIALSKILPEDCKAAQVLVKMEMQNPSGSLKDRIALSMIEAAEKEKLITPGVTTLVDFTSGNTGIAEAMIAAAKGYKCIICMPQVPAMHERYVTCRQFGAEVHLLNPSVGPPGWFAYIDELRAKPNHFYINQMENMDNPAAHIANTGPEVWKQTDGKVDIFVHGIGTGGTISGVGQFLKSKKPDVKICALEPSESRVHVGQSPSTHGIVGWAPGFHSNFLEGVSWEKDKLSDAPRGVVDEWLHTSTLEAMDMAKRLARTEGMMVGPSSGAAIKVAIDLACRPESAGKTIVVLAPSHGIRYTASPLWSEMMQESARALPKEVCKDKDKGTLMWDSSNPTEQA